MKYRVTTELNLHTKEFSSEPALMFALRSAKVLAKNNPQGLLVLSEDQGKSKPLVRIWPNEETGSWEFQSFNKISKSLQKEISSFCDSSVAHNEPPKPPDPTPGVA